MENKVPIRIVENPVARQAETFRRHTRWAAPGHCARVQRFHRTLSGYGPTPLVALNGLAARVGLAGLWIKDESLRFDLAAFKVLGVSWALENLPAPAPDRVRPPVTCVTASDGNHGRALAWAAGRRGWRSVVFLPADVSPGRAAAVRRLGGRVEIVAGTYDLAVRRASEAADRNGWLLVQDTAWPGYAEIPRRIMQGYLTLFEEAFHQLRGETPTHLFVQAGVGSFAAAALAYAAERFGTRRPRLVVVEPDRAGCYFASIGIGDGSAHRLEGPLDTLMGGLSCGRPSDLAWRILAPGADAFAVCADAVATEGMRLLARPPCGDPPVVSGESGAVTLGLVNRLMRDPAGRGLRRRLALDSDSRVLLVSTEGATDPEVYRRLLGGEGMI